MSIVDVFMSKACDSLLLYTNRINLTLVYIFFFRFEKILALICPVLTSIQDQLSYLRTDLLNQNIVAKNRLPMGSGQYKEKWRNVKSEGNFCDTQDYQLNYA